MDEFLVGETLRLLCWRTELLEIMNGLDADRRVRRWLAEHRQVYDDARRGEPPRPSQDVRYMPGSAASASQMMRASSPSLDRLPQAVAELGLTISRYMQAGAFSLPEKIMFRALGWLLLRGALSVGICAVTALCLTGFLSLIATSLEPKKQAVAEAITNGNCKPNHCRPKTSGGRQVVAAKAQ
jgi:hypothetical protein